jgi:transcription elongation factor GreA
MDASLVTPSGLRKLTSELELLRAKREALLRVPRAEAEGGGVNAFAAELLDSSELVRLERQIAVLEDRLASAVVVHPEPGDGELDVGELALVRDLETGELVEYRIVGAGEANPGAGSISYASPVGAALLGRRVGEVIEVEVPKGLLRLEVVGIEM